MLREQGLTLFSRSEWKDPSWKTLPSLRRGLTDVESDLRTILFGRNAIEVVSRGTFALLIDEVLHPFYIFQVLSIALWAFDDYYCAFSLSTLCSDLS